MLVTKTRVVDEHIKVVTHADGLDLGTATIGKVAIDHLELVNLSIAMLVQCR
jgi:hypothetical protein